MCLCIRGSGWVAHVPRMQVGLIHNVECTRGKCFFKLPAHKRGTWLAQRLLVRMYATLQDCKWVKTVMLPDSVMYAEFPVDRIATF